MRVSFRYQLALSLAYLQVCVVVIIAGVPDVKLAAVQQRLQLSPSLCLV